MKIISSFIYSLSVIIILLSGCTNSSQTKLKDSKTPGLNYDTVLYTIKTITKNDPGCDSSKDKHCQIINIKYHVFDGHPVLNDSIRSELLAVYPFRQPGSPAPASIEEQAGEFMKKYEEFKKEPYSGGRKYELIASTKLLAEAGNLLTLQLDAYTYSGGAHGASFTQFFNYDIANKKMFFLKDVIKENYKDSLVNVAEIIFKKNEGLQPG